MKRDDPVFKYAEHQSILPIFNLAAQVIELGQQCLPLFMIRPQKFRIQQFEPVVELTINTAARFRILIQNGDSYTCPCRFNCGGDSTGARTDNDQFGIFQPSTSHRRSPFWVSKRIPGRAGVWQVRILGMPSMTIVQL